MRRVLITAHPDDEILWCGGILQRFEWDVICCSIPRRDPIRAWKFHEAVKTVGATPKLFPAVEPHPSESIPYLENIDLEEYDHILTHNQWGEYGHKHHVDVHNYVVSKYQHKKLSFIGYRKDGVGKQTIKLSPDELGIKLNALKKYDHCLPYGNGNPPKWEALLHRYCTEGGLDIATETYDGDVIA